MQRPTLVRALKRGAEPIRSGMAARAPRGKNTPHLADSMIIRATARVDGARIAETQAAVAVGPSQDVYWGRFNEFGTVHQPARPFARPAFDAGITDALDLVGQELWIELRRLAEGGIGASFTASEPSGSGL
jgi:HK97 gp10 family phage protein